MLYSELLISGKLNDYLANINEQAEAMFSRLVKQLADKERLLSSDGGFSFSGSNQEVIKFREEWKKVNTLRKKKVIF